ncbi:MAG TPA: ABC transporter ATP-binding protein [Candidatus Desulfofervidus auxilii]|uniref:ABC transporter ATP-binding protein n=1 Tax=Desulfofervidus auxilii TaxID=1621989 RepID=A0A7C0Y9L2_DESA2|nr:ABC transporter ATP-binding protein [Candidatus Desulfofervidus auxilii]
MIIFKDVWKKYYRHHVFHRSLREDIVNFFKRKQKQELKKNEFWALKGISFEIKKGECVGLYGPNGAGKSTILKLIAKVTYPTKGIVNVNGRVAPLIEIGAGFHLDLTGRENIYINGAILGMHINEIKRKIPQIVEFSELEEFIDMPVKKYSSGMYLRLGFSIAIHSEADIFLIDEILAVGDEAFQEKCLEKIKNLKKQGKTMLFVTHNRELMEKIADRTIFMEKGKVVKK